MSVSSYTEDAQSVINASRMEAKRFRHNYLGPEHVILGILSVQSGAAFAVLENYGVTLQKARSAIEFIIGYADGYLPDNMSVRTTDRMNKILFIAEDLTHEFNLAAISDLVLLLALVREGESIACGILESLGINPSSLQKVIEKVIPRGPTLSTGVRLQHLDQLNETVNIIPLWQLRDSLKLNTGFVFLLETAAKRIDPGLWPVIQERPYLIEFAKQHCSTILRINEEIYGACPREDVLVLMSKDEVTPTPHVFECPVCEYHFQELRAQHLAYEAGTTPAAWFKDEEPPPVDE